MAGLIRREDIDAVRERADLKEIVEQYVTLKKAGIGSWKGLCPFHDERSPSFHIRPQVGTYHCFGCGESGDVIAFLQSQEHTSFQETVESLAQKYGVELRYEDGGTRSDPQETGRRQRLLDAHKIAAEFYAGQLLSPEAEIGRHFLTERGFTREHAEHFGIGYAPKGWDALLKRLRQAGFSTEELSATGLFSEGNRGLYDRFRGRLIWPIADMTGTTIGFGGRRLHADDKGPKYLNSPETSIYKKSQVLYGIHYAKRSIAKKRQLVIVEGYTDVMACHLAGVDTAVATCGTAFGEEHSKITRRLLSDDGEPAEVIFTFDGDDAGQNAALKAFRGDHHFTAQTFIAIGPEGMDPCDIRQQRGDSAVAELINHKVPLVEFAMRHQLGKWDLDTVEGRVGALHATVPILTGIRDTTLRQAYTRELAGWLGVDIAEVLQVMDSAPSSGSKARRRSGEPREDPNPQDRNRPAGDRGRPGSDRGQGTAQRSAGSGSSAITGPDSVLNESEIPRPDTSAPGVLLERQALEVVLQQPTLLSAEQWQEFFSVQFLAPAHHRVHEAIRAVAAEVADPRQWVTATAERVPQALRGFVAELAVTSLPAATQEHLERYCREIMNRLVEHKIQQQKSLLMGRLQRMDPRAPQEVYHQLNTELMELENRRRALKRVD